MHRRLSAFENIQDNIVLLRYSLSCVNLLVLIILWVLNVWFGTTIGLSITATRHIERDGVSRLVRIRLIPDLGI